LRPERTRNPNAIDVGSIFEALTEPAVVTDTEGNILAQNSAVERFLGYESESLTHVEQLFGGVLPLWWGELLHTPTGSQTQDAPLRNAEGSVYMAEVVARWVPHTGQTQIFLTARDLSRRAELEAQLRQATKMEAVGRLAGGVAHDFNNLLSVILTNVHFIEQGLAKDSPHEREVGQIKEATTRATQLTNQLLAFGRRQVLNPEPVNWSSICVEIVPLLQRVIGEDVQLVTDLDANPASFLGDVGQLTQVLMNLTVNARDAMPNGGTLSLSNQTIEVSNAMARSFPGLEPGTYATLIVQDTGTGMAPEVQARLFEPFYTTKEDSSGLGLAMVYGIMKQSNGFIYCQSVPSKGSRFQLMVPVTELRPQVRTPEPARRVTRQSANETILLVEDEDLVRRAASRALERSGYKVLRARNAGEALLIFEQHSQEIQLLLTDVVMPHMGGGQLAARLQRSRPDLPILLMTGYTDDAVLRHGFQEGSFRLLRKPFTPEALVTAARRTLDDAERSSMKRSKRVLIIDDDRLLASALRRLLRGNEVESERTLAGARAQLERGQFDLVLCDLNLPDGHGSDLLNWMHETCPEQLRRTVVLTGGFDRSAYPLPKHIEVIEKPVQPRTLQRVLQRVAGPITATT